MTSERVQEWNDLNFESLISEIRGAVLVDFTADWCPPCKALSPVVSRIADETQGRVTVASVDADACPNLAAKFRIRGLPTLVVFRDGREVGRRVGLTNEEGIRALLRPAFERADSATALATCVSTAANR